VFPNPHVWQYTLSSLCQRGCDDGDGDGGGDGDGDGDLDKYVA